MPRAEFDAATFYAALDAAFVLDPDGYRLEAVIQKITGMNFFVPPWPGARRSSAAIRSGRAPSPYLRSRPISARTRICRSPAARR